MEFVVFENFKSLFIPNCTRKTIRLFVDNMIINQLRLSALSGIDWRALSQSAYADIFACVLLTL